MSESYIKLRLVRAANSWDSVGCSNLEQEKKVLPVGGLMKNSPYIVLLFFTLCLPGCPGEQVEISPIPKPPTQRHTSTLQPPPQSHPELPPEPAPTTPVPDPKTATVPNPITNTAPVAEKKTQPVIAAGRQHTLLIKPN
ncbi:uncharacterized protein METZ01_LOCUS364880, partial [marine metagenome]